MNKEKRAWEKGTSSPIPDRKYKNFKEKIAEDGNRYSDRNLMLFLLGRATGYRMGDLVGLTIGDIKDAIEDGYFLIQESKQYKSWLNKISKQQDNENKKVSRKPDKRRASIEENLDKYLRNYVKGKKRSEYAFLSNKDGCHIEAKSFSEILSKIGKELRIDNISGHSLRKTYATKIYQKSGNNLEQVRVALNHQSIEETKRYLGIKEAMIREASKMASDDI